MADTVSGKRPQWITILLFGRGLLSVPVASPKSRKVSSKNCQSLQLTKTLSEIIIRWDFLEGRCFGN